jgi:hypothetical protein
VIRLSQSDIERFAAWSSDRNPLHVDHEFARQTYFGRPVAHGVLTALDALASTAGDWPGHSVKSIDIEFRGAAVAGQDYAAESTCNGEGIVVSLRAPDQLVLNARLELGRLDDGLGTEWSWVGGAAHGALRANPAPRTPDELSRGIELVGTYPLISRPGESGPLSDAQVSVVGMCFLLV